MRRRLFIASSGLLLLGLAACTSDSIDDDPSTDDLSGRIVVLGNGGRVSVVGPDGGDEVTVVEESDSVRRFQPIWAPATQSLAWSEDGPEGSSIVLAEGVGVVESISTPSFPFYMSWSPDGSLIGALMNGSPGELDFRIYDPQTAEGDIVGSGSPFYFSWSPESDAVVAHVGGDSLLLFDESGEPSSLGTTHVGYLAPMWTDAGIVFRNPDGVVIVDNVDAGRVLATSSRFLNLTANRTGTLLAVQPLTGAAPEGITIGLGATDTDELADDVVTIVDIGNGETHAGSDGIALGMFWSPDGQKLMMPVLASSDGEIDVVVWEGGVSTRLATMRLSTGLVRDALQFGDQYSQSWQVWDPDSRAVVFPGTIGETTGVWVMGVGAEPELIADGSWAAWSSG